MSTLVCSLFFFWKYCYLYLDHLVLFFRFLFSHYFCLCVLLSSGRNLPGLFYYYYFTDLIYCNIQSVARWSTVNLKLVTIFFYLLAAASYSSLLSFHRYSVSFSLEDANQRLSNIFSHFLGIETVIEIPQECPYESFHMASNFLHRNGYNKDKTVT